METPNPPTEEKTSSPVKRQVKISSIVTRQSKKSKKEKEPEQILGLCVKCGTNQRQEFYWICEDCHTKEFVSGYLKDKEFLALLATKDSKRITPNDEQIKLLIKEKESWGGRWCYRKPIPENQWLKSECCHKGLKSCNGIKTLYVFKSPTIWQCDLCQRKMCDACKSGSGKCDYCLREL